MLILVLPSLTQLTIPLPLLLGGKISATMAVLKLILPLLIPPIILAITNKPKLRDTAHSAYDSATPTCRINNYSLLCIKGKRLIRLHRNCLGVFGDNSGIIFLIYQ